MALRAVTKFCGAIVRIGKRITYLSQLNERIEDLPKRQL